MVKIRTWIVLLNLIAYRLKIKQLIFKKLLIGEPVKKIAFKLDLISFAMKNAEQKQMIEIVERKTVMKAKQGLIKYRHAVEFIRNELKLPINYSEAIGVLLDKQFDLDKDFINGMIQHD